MDEFITNCSLIIAILLGPCLLLALMIWFMVQAFLDIKSKVIQIYHLRSTPCGQCLYYTGCKELACAVQPYLALTKSARNCRDFTPADTPNPPNMGYSKCSDASGHL